MKHFLYVLFFMVVSTGAVGQGQANFWYFGQHAAIDFNSGVPVTTFGSAMGTREGCASISTPSGDLLFYTDGTSVWDKNNQCNHQFAAQLLCS